MNGKARKQGQLNRIPITIDELLMKVGIQVMMIDKKDLQIQQLAEQVMALEKRLVTAPTAKEPDKVEGDGIPLPDGAN